LENYLTRGRGAVIPHSSAVIISNLPLNQEKNIEKRKRHSLTTTLSMRHAHKPDKGKQREPAKPTVA